MVPCVRICSASASIKIATSCFLLILTLNVNWLQGIGDSLKRLFEISHLGRFWPCVFSKISVVVRNGLWEKPKLCYSCSLAIPFAFLMLWYWSFASREAKSLAPETKKSAKIHPLYEIRSVWQCVGANTCLHFNSVETSEIDSSINRKNSWGLVSLDSWPL